MAKTGHPMREHTIAIRVTTDELDTLDRVCEAEYIPRTALIRQIVMPALRLKAERYEERSRTAASA